MMPRQFTIFTEIPAFSQNDSRWASIFHGIEYSICRTGSVFDPRELNTVSPNAEEITKSASLDPKARDVSYT